jgi:hypothetical protein
VGAADAAAAWRGLAWRPDAAILGLAGVILVTTVLRLTLFASTPLGLDETWTGDIASQPSPAAFLHRALQDVNGPLAYALAWALAPILGLSNGALRAPETLAACLTPLLPLLFGRGMSRPSRLVWSALLACWLPGLIFAQIARSYALILFFATAEAIAFIGLLRRPSLGAALAWCGLSSLLILAHYSALPLAAVQGFAYLAIHRGRAVKTWPAALAFAPAFGCIALQIGQLSGFSQGGHTWIDTLTPGALPGLAAFLVGGGPALIGVLVWAAVGVALASGKGSGEGFGEGFGGARGPDRAELYTAVTGVLALLLVVGLGFVRPVVTPRYLTPEAPTVLLGVSLAATRFGRGARIMPALLTAGLFGLCLGLAVNRPQLGDGSFEKAAHVLMAKGVRRVEVFWDNPVNLGGDPGALTDFGAFFFRRAGDRATILAPSAWTDDMDPSAVLSRRASAPGDGFIWIYDRAVAGTRALARPPHLDPALDCGDYGAVTFSVLACIRPPRPGHSHGADPSATSARRPAEAARRD